MGFEPGGLCADGAVTAFVFDRLPRNFTADELENWLHALDDYQFSASEMHAPPRIVNLLEQLPEGEEYVNVDQVWEEIS